MSGLIILLALAFLQGTFSELVCEELPVQMCSFSIASSGKRCLLETSGANPGLQCKTSQVMATSMTEYIENDNCVDACGVDRNSIGISSDSLLDTHFARKLCSPECYNNCPNIVDLYHNLAQAEGILFRVMIQLQSSSAAYSPVSAGADALNCAPPPM